MSGTFDDRNRQVIPRWLSYETSCSLGQLRTIEKSVYPSDIPVYNPQTALDWRSTPNLLTAVDLVAESLILKDFDAQQSCDAAHFILNNAPQSSSLIREIADHFLYEPTNNGEVININYTQNYARSCIAILKKSVRRHPLNPIAWSDLALCYAMLGLTKKSHRSMQVSLALGKHNRFILRSATNCFFYAEDPVRAVELLRRSSLCDSDPWIAAAEIAISDRMKFRSACINAGRKLVENDNVSLYARSELAAALCTMEAKSGSHKMVKHHARQALKNPSENALAQIEWLATQRHTRPPSKTKAPASYEAAARHHYRDKQFDKSLIAAEQWARFQPLSSQPLIQATFISSVCLNNDRSAVNIANTAAPTHRRNPLLMNNLAFALARQGDIKAAAEALHRINPSNLQNRERLAISATKGLICFRLGEIEKGRKLYNNAIIEFERMRDSRSAAIATFFLAFEEKRSCCSEASARIADAKKKVKKFDIFELEDAANAL